MPFALIIALLTGAYELIPALIAFANSMTLFITGPMLDPVLWTLRVETIFYLLIIVWMMLGWTGRLPLLAVILAAYSAAFNLANVEGLISLPSAVERVLLLRHGSFFALGILMWLGTTRKLKLWELGGCALAIAGASCELIEMDRSNGMLIVWFSVMIVLWFALRTSVSWSGRFAGFARRLGLMTFPLYLLHETVGSGSVRALVRIGVSDELATFVGAAIAISASFFVASSLERPVRKLLVTALDTVESMSRRDSLVEVSQ